MDWEKTMRMGTKMAPVPSVGDSDFDAGAFGELTAYSRLAIRTARFVSTADH